MNDLQTYQGENPTVSGHNVEVEKSRAVTEVQSAMIIAKKFPRDYFQAHTRIMKSCERPSLAAKALYSYPRGGQNVTGPSIRLAEVMAQNYGNLDYGIKILDRSNGRSLIESYCWDLESNVKSSRVFEVPHERTARGAIQKLTDPRDISEMELNQGSRKLRSCILQVIPGDFQEDAVERVKKVLASSNGESVSDKVKRVLLAFLAFGVDQKMIENKLGHDISLTTIDEIVELQTIYNSLKDKVAKKTDFFDVKKIGSDEAFVDKTKPKAKASVIQQKPMDVDLPSDEPIDELERQRMDVFNAVQNKIKAKMDAGAVDAEIENTIGFKLYEVEAQDMKTLLKIAKDLK